MACVIGRATGHKRSSVANLDVIARSWLAVTAAQLQFARHFLVNKGNSRLHFIGVIRFCGGAGARNKHLHRGLRAALPAPSACGTAMSADQESNIACIQCGANLGVREIAGFRLARVTAAAAIGRRPCAAK